MRCRRTFFGLLVTVTHVASAQRPDPPILWIAPSASRLETRPISLAEPQWRLAIADSVRRKPTYWKTGLWFGVATGVLLGTAIAIDNLGEPATSSEKARNAFLLSGVLAVPLGVIGGLIGNAIKKPAAAGPAPP